VFGGREHPRQSGYTINRNLFTELPCSPCWYWNHCPHGHECMHRISPRDVVDAARLFLERPHRGGTSNGGDSSNI
jgi:hypothetical protein